MSKTTGKTIQQHYQGLKRSKKKERLENDLRTVHLDPEYNYYDPLKDEKFALMGPSNDGRSVKFCRRACNSHTEKRLRWRKLEEFIKILSTLDSDHWVNGGIQGPAQYPDELEANFRTLRNSSLKRLFKEAPVLTEPLDKLVKSGKYLTDTQLKQVLTHLGLSNQALVNALDVDPHLMDEGAAVDTQKLEFLREFIEKGRTPGDVISLEATDQLELIFHWMVERIPPQTKNKLMNIFQTTESVHPKNLFCLLLEQIPVWTDDVSRIRSLTEASHKEGIVMENIERLKRRVSYSIEFPNSMEKSVAPDNQVTLLPFQCFSGVE